jgi:replication initiation and membrane attachment protein DnaB
MVETSLPPSGYADTIPKQTHILKGIPMQVFKLALVILLSFAVIGPAHAKNTMPRGYMNSAAESIGNNSEYTNKSARKKWGENKRSEAKNFANKEGRKHRKEPKWRNEQRTKNKKSSSSNSGVND